MKMAKSKKTRFLNKIKRNLKNLNKRTIVCAVIVQVLLIAVFADTIAESRPINTEDTKQVTVTVEETKRISGSKGPKWFIVYSDSDKYYFTEFGIFGKYSNRELEEQISVGDELTLTYFEHFHILKNRNLVVEASKENQVFRTLEEYNEQYSGVNIAAIIIFVILEILFLVIPILVFIVL